DPGRDGGRGVPARRRVAWPPRRRVRARAAALLDRAAARELGPAGRAARRGARAGVARRGRTLAGAVPRSRDGGTLGEPGVPRGDDALERIGLRPEAVLRPP